jgi:hypothetical protein
VTRDDQNQAYIILPKSRGPSIVPSGFAIAASMTFSGINLLPCPYYWDAAQA